MEEVEVMDSAKIVHSRICSNFEVVERTLYDICTDLKTIRDNKYYKTLGYNTFEDYCLKNFNISRKQGYQYISIAENIKNVTPGLQNLGVRKLYCLSRLTENERSELMENVDIEKTSAKELETKSKQIRDNKKAIPDDNTIFPSEQIKLSDLDKLFVCLDDLRSHLVL